MWIGVIDKSSTINIIGAGISGLLAGFYLKKQGCSVELWDTASSTGGKISSNITSLGLVESAANAIILDKHVLALLQDLHLSYLPARPKLKRWIQDRDKPISSSAFALSFLKSFALKGMRKTPHTKNYLHTTLSDFFIPLLGYEVSTQIFSAVTRGIYAKNADELTLDAFFSPNFLSTLPAKKLSYWEFIFRFIKYKKKNTSQGSVSFPYGMQELINALTHSLKDHIHLKTPTEHITTLIEEGNALVCNTPPQVQHILRNIYPHLSQMFSEIPMTDVHSTTIFTNRKVSLLDGSFGVLYTPRTETNFCGILAQSEIFPQRVSNEHIHSYTVIGSIEPVEKILDTFKKMTSLTSENILHHEHYVWKKSIPVYNRLRQEQVLKIQDSLLQQKTSIAFFGNYLFAIGLKDLVRGAQSL